MSEILHPKAAFEELQMANATITTTNIKGKEYAEVNQRIKAFRMVYPGGQIITELMSNEGGVCVFKATVCDHTGFILGTGTAYEKESSSYINKTSYIENCETSAVGRALGMCGFGIDTSVASADEVLNAVNNQQPAVKPYSGAQTASKFHKEKEPLADPKDIDRIEQLAEQAGVEISKLEKKYKVKVISGLSPQQAAECIAGLQKMVGFEV